MRVSVIIPTFKRAEYLARALRGLAGQTRQADQVVLGVREGDSETAEFLASASVEVKTVPTSEPGVVASMSAALAMTDGDIVCLLDDDAEPLPDWLERIEGRFAKEPKLGIIGGRDLLRDHPEMRAAEPTTTRVGVFTWYGRFLGNHHRGGGGFRRVDTLKGCNAAARGDLLRRIGFEMGLRGAGAQVHWEVALCLDVAAAGFDVAYDPEIRVIHHIAPRYGVDQSHRGGFSPEGLFDMVWNEHFVVSRRLSAGKKIRHLLWAVLVGSLDAPGLVQYVRLFLRRDPRRNGRFAITMRAICSGRKHRSA
ncbi:MAG: glycosyltransferase [Terrimicrobiaceae bacterium]